MRFFNMLWANFFGYFWLPCPRCGKFFGGHEVRGQIVTSESNKLLTCCENL
jgi:hypothetical protein